ncbi:hypothetical protein, partial [Neomegalonema sp.]|uniref:hypothetical protein n=1 Tax=Neomegalonema sp. TaxID=2039713 RepID=UPI0026319B7D
MGAIDKIKSFPATKQEQQDFSREILRQVSDGVINPLHVKIWMKSVQDAFDLVLKNEGFDRLMMNEADKYSAEKRFLVLNAECEMTARTLYDFSKDSKWVKL